MPKHDGPYAILTQRSPASYESANLDSLESPIGTYHVSALKPFTYEETTPIAPLRKRGKSKKSDVVSNTSRNLETEEEVATLGFP
ncbi:hypothetical protein CDAR_584271 [Caerostris darwini]|uniref:Uncharacterized protein n=1 Tax=Caerostris darwini TaxID=1538125 RepID=A0AAV4VT91_9ARAC|nr:hypothetical protein CDAR_584271 [Caerostris darwini]